MKDKTFGYWLGCMFGAILIGSIALSGAALIISTVIRIIMRMF